MPELLLILVEFPVTILLMWFCFCLKIKVGFFGFLFNLCMPVFAILGVILFLFIGSRYANEGTTLDGDYKEWITLDLDNIKDADMKAKVASWKGSKIPMREAYTWYKLEYLHFNKPLLEVFLHRYHLFQMVFTKDSF